MNYYIIVPIVGVTAEEFLNWFDSRSNDSN